jgi:ribosomal protein L35AE/L33A
LVLGSRVQPQPVGVQTEVAPLFAEASLAHVEDLLTLEERSWMRVSVDGTIVFEQVAEQGETLPFPGEQEIVVRYGNAGGVRVEFNGEDLGPPGARGDVVEVVYTPDGPDTA